MTKENILRIKTLIELFKLELIVGNRFLRESSCHTLNLRIKRAAEIFGISENETREIINPEDGEIITVISKLLTLLMEEELKELKNETNTSAI